MKRRSFRILITFTFFIFDFGCAHTVSEVCSRDLVMWKSNVHHALDLLENRTLASSSANVIKDNLVKWSEEQLKIVEKKMGGYFRAGSRRRNLKADLSDMANLWVEFHGYAQLGKKSRMIEMLHRISLSQEKLENSFCSLSSESK